MKPLSRDWLEETLWWPVWRKWDTLRTLWRHKLYIPHYYQRARYGYSYMDEWSMDIHIARIMARHLAHFKDHHSGFPGSLKSDEEWTVILSQMQEAFELILADDYSLATLPEHQPKIDRGLLLFAKYFQNLWD